MKVDCHIHSLHSDGIYTIDQIIPMLVKRNIQVFSITDHDCVDGIIRARELNCRKMNFISGIEFTCKEILIAPIQKSFSVHLLGYDFDETNSQLLDVLKTRKENVLKVFDDLCEEITNSGFPISRKNVPISCGNVLQLSDVVHYIDSKYKHIPDFVYDLVHHYGTKLNNANIPVGKAINLIHNAGGKAVWAHPFYVYKDFKKMKIFQEDVTATLDTLRKLGLDGLEALYLSFTETEREWLYHKVCDKNMIYTAGSDFHGSKGRDAMGITLFSPGNRKETRNHFPFL